MYEPSLRLSDKKIRILNFDGSILRQKKLINKFSHSPYSLEIVDFKNIAPFVRYWANRKDLDNIRKILSIDSKNTITLYGSGDFHHLSLVLIEQFSYPLSVIIFDHHPDWDGLSLPLSCGAWVNTLVRKENIKKVILLGPSSDDLSSRGLFTACFWGLKHKKLEIYPYEHAPSRIFFRFLKNIDCMEITSGLINSEIKWNNLREKDLDIFLSQILERLPTDNIYISIDKDCLKADYALTNWEAGLIDLEWLLQMLNVIKERKNIVGLDITGDYSPILLKGRLKNFFSHLDHPKETHNTKYLDKVDSINEATNLKILEVFIR